MAKLSKEQIKQLTDRPALYTTIRLMCDGYHIALQDTLVKRQMRTALFVNGSMKGKWLVHPESKFYRRHVRYYKKDINSKALERIDLDMCQSDFASIGQALRHLNSVCYSVEIYQGE